MEIKVLFNSEDSKLKGKISHPVSQPISSLKSKISEKISMPCCFFCLLTEINKSTVLMTDSFSLSFFTSTDSITVSIKVINQAKCERYVSLTAAISENRFNDFLAISKKNEFPDLYTLKAMQNHWTHLHFAASVGASFVLDEILKTASPDINLETRDCWTALMLSAAHGHLENCKRLSKVPNININHCNRRGTALHCAVKNGHKNVVEYLLFCQASVSIEDEKGKKPIEITDDHEILELIAKFHGFLDISKYAGDEKPVFAGEVFLYNSGIFSDSSVFLFINLEKGTLEEHASKTSFLNRVETKDYILLIDIEEIRERFKKSWNIKGNFYFQVTTDSSIQIYYAKSEVLRNEWIEKIGKAVEYCKENRIGVHKHKISNLFTVIESRENINSPGLLEENIDIDDFERLNELGSGSFASVYKVKHNETGKIYAMKCLSKKFLEKKKMLSYAETEIEIMKELDHPFILKLVYSISTSACFYLILEFCEQGDLESLLEKKKCSELQAKFYLAEMVLALEYLHSKNVMYRDLKPANVLVDKSGHIKLADFGLAKAIDELEQSVSTIVGSPAYISPEILTRENITKATDKYALGIVMHELLTGALPFSHLEMDKIFSLIRNSKFAFSSSLHKDAKDLIKMLLNRKAEKRPSYEKIKNHDFFNGIDWKLLGEKRYLPPSFDSN